MKINEKELAHFSLCGRKSDFESWLWKKNDTTSSYQKRWCILKGNLFFYFEKKGEKEPVGFIVLENSYIQLAEGTEFSFAFCIHFLGEGTRVYKFASEDEEICTSWIKELSTSSYKYLSILVKSLEADLENKKATIKKKHEKILPTITLESDDSDNEKSNFSPTLIKYNSLNDILDSTNNYGCDDLSDGSLDENDSNNFTSIVRSKSSLDISSSHSDNSSSFAVHSVSGKKPKSSKSKQKRSKLKKISAKATVKYFNNSLKNLKNESPSASTELVNHDSHLDEVTSFKSLEEDQLVFAKLHERYKEDIAAFIHQEKM